MPVEANPSLGFRGSAALDLHKLISKLSNGGNTFVYGTAYQALIVERLMHLDPPEVTGYANEYHGIIQL
ncbi:uncharacterized protein PHALS_11372 [Plasmopara halstedii]|uniref:Uncharacterized protein n=1 Tax=Plasmopara halstedii TaxID=4781 RepID=A0A0P1A5T9_PLAHL|nr:uncharacterized protein PHALS_11372 [Plasmopara halstedii]CEG35493.1 hypothetical protein PHALS_11372 [Plasmopara halstedii]|eukprot:XP_024571862.1 hypothetical protein PHALS_11372 [Plasmopara halstedii]